MASGVFRIAAIAVGVLVAIAAVGFGALWVSPDLQDKVMARVIKGRLADNGPAKLLDDGALHVFLCGTGSPMPDPTRANACTAIIAGGHVVVIDTGPGSWSKFSQSRLPAGNIDTILLTHLHSDHIGDLGEFAVQSWIAGRAVPINIYGPAKLPSPALAPDSRGHEYGTSGTLDVVEGFALAYDADSAYRILHHGADYLKPEGARIVGHEIPTPKVDELVTVFDQDGLKISAFLVNHHPVEPAYGYRVEYKGRVAVISGDTKKTESVERFSQNADLLVHEALNAHMVSLIIDGLKGATNPRLGKMAHDTLDYHTSPVQAAEIANAAGVKLLVFSHIVPPLPNALSQHMFMEGVADARGQGDTRLGHDGMMITLPGGTSDVKVADLF
jgi:ribonuclease Z